MTLIAAKRHDVNWREREVHENPGELQPLMRLSLQKRQALLKMRFACLFNLKKKRGVKMVAIENAGAFGIAAAIALFGGALGTGFAQASIGSSIVGYVAERPEDTFKLIVYIAIPELIVLLGFVIAIMLLGSADKALGAAVVE